ncbi:MAG: cytochrome b/b6 domain-containing protein [Dokdonella sp.]
MYRLRELPVEIPPSLFEEIRFMPPLGATTATVGVAARPRVYTRHTLAIRVMHWINVLAFFLMLMSGLQIFNAHPALNWGKSSYDGKPPLLEIGAHAAADGAAVGTTTIFGREFTTTGVLGVSAGDDGSPAVRAFPAWATLPGVQWLAMARSWHFFFAWIFLLNGLCYVVYSVATRHLRRDLLPNAADTRSIGRSLKDHLLLRHPKGEAATHYNVLQKLTYLVVIFVLLPGIIVMGWAMSPWIDALWPGWIDLVGGRQSARTLHFVFAFALLAFVLVHVFEVAISGLWNNLRSMISGRYVVPPEDTHE